MHRCPATHVCSASPTHMCNSRNLCDSRHQLSSCYSCRGCSVTGQCMCRFYQHLPTGCEWDWGLVWGHAISTDLVHWEHLPPALRPSPGFLDADGCFSGCCTVDEAGVPTIMYTGVRLRSNQDCGPLPPADCDLQLPFIESQLLARCDPSMLPQPHSPGCPRQPSRTRTLQLGIQKEACISLALPPSSLSKS